MFHAVDENNNDDVSPLCVANVDPSTSTTAASRIMDSGVLVVEFQMPTTFFAGGVSSTASPDQLKAFVGQVKRFHYAVDFLLEHDFKKTLRIVKATPSMIWVVSNAVVLGNSNSSSSSASSDVSLIEAGLDILRHLCPQHGLIGRALIDSGPFVGILLGTSSMSFEFTGPVMERARALLEAAAWGGLFVTHRLIRYCGGTADLRMSAATATMEVKTPRGLIGKISGNFEPWRVARAPKILVAAVVV
ncbi:Hypothetical protein, putative [Bodo saltans]|uniref:Uncharacterized protein n=1 Tax=Bodo saltans TaxID=75058 RepID=A0A0S4INP0_BODSA|nr:Hypothetical protein, putative [Bodo saltans]|eukprot:CUE77177.1 Hypothetical protein, putative [Bodo saltans]